MKQLIVTILLIFQSFSPLANAKRLDYLNSSFETYPTIETSTDYNLNLATENTEDKPNTTFGNDYEVETFVCLFQSSYTDIYTDFYRLTFLEIIFSKSDRFQSLFRPPIS